MNTLSLAEIYKSITYHFNRVFLFTTQVGVLQERINRKLTNTSFKIINDIVTLTEQRYILISYIIMQFRNGS